MTRKQVICLTVAFFLLGILIIPVAAKGTKGGMTVTLAWRPDTQLTSLDNGGDPFPTFDSGDDYRYVDLEVMVTSNVNYWTTQITCTVDPTILGNYSWDEDGNSTPDDHGDNAPPVWWGRDLDEAAWVFNTPVPGTVEFTASKYGYSYPLGGNGTEITQRLLTFRFRVLPQASPFNTMVVPNCQASFLDINGEPIGAKVVYNPMPMLKVMSGYSISGQLLYQGDAFDHAGIGVDCRYWTGPATFVSNPTMTDAAGNFALTNLRDDGGYECIFFGNVIAPGDNPDLHLSAHTWVNLWSDSIHLLPTILRSGNTDRSGNPESGDENVDNDDVAQVTSNWETGVPPTTSGDANGDGFIDASDLAIVASSFDQHEYNDAEHYIATVKPFESAMVYHNVWSPHIQQLGNTKGNAYWPALSPDGSMLAYIEEGKGGFALTILPLNDPKAKPYVLTPSKWEYSAFAPAWSEDGTQLAFVCAMGDDWMYPEFTHDFCVINADGSGLRSVAWGANLNRPTWFHNDILLYGGDKWDGQTIYMTDTGSGQSETLDYNIPEGASLPQVVWYENGPGMFYLYEGTLRFADIVEDDDFWDWDPDTPAIAEFEDIESDPVYPYHLVAKYDDGAYETVSDNIDYYEVPLNSRPEVVFTEMFEFGGGWYFARINFDWEAEDPTWWEPNYWSYPGQEANPWWNGNPDEPTDLFARRNTINWTP